MKELIAVYEENLRLICKRIDELRAGKKQNRTGDNPVLDRRLALLYTERLELRTAIGRMKGYLKAWEEDI